MKTNNIIHFLFMKMCFSNESKVLIAIKRNLNVRKCSIIATISIQSFVNDLHTTISIICLHVQIFSHTCVICCERVKICLHLESTFVLLVFGIIMFLALKNSTYTYMEKV